MYASYWHALWIYFTAPPPEMLAAAEVSLLVRGEGPYCAKLHHHNNQRCIFHHCRHSMAGHGNRWEVKENYLHSMARHRRIW